MKNENIKRIISSLILLPLALFFIIKGSNLFIFFILICFFISLLEWHRMTKKIYYKFFGIIFLICSFFSCFLLRGNNIDDLKIFIFTILICISTDMGGFIFGKIFKGPKLTKISPNKTYAGMIGSYLLSIIVILLYENKFEFNNMNNIELPIVVLLISSVSQLGDIIISYFKRNSNIKNTGNIIPGHGGLLDRIDGMIFAIPFTFLIFKIL